MFITAARESFSDFDERTRRIRTGPFRSGRNCFHFGKSFRVPTLFCCRYAALMFHDEPAVERTITLSRKDMQAARRLLHLLLGAEQMSSDDLRLRPTARPAVTTDRAALVARARVEFRNRRHRIDVFGQSMFGEAAWDMLLALYILETSGARQTVGTLLHFAGTPLTTAKRWLDFLAEHDLVRRDPHPTDRRTAFVSLTVKAREKLDLYYSGTIETPV
jgi:DNA-binding MarR family transcriptional regulator